MLLVGQTNSPMLSHAKLPDRQMPDLDDPGILRTGSRSKSSYSG
jgi:hypothetical protein